MRREEERAREFHARNPDPSRAYPCRVDYDAEEEDRQRRAWCGELRAQVRVPLPPLYSLGPVSPSCFTSCLAMVPLLRRERVSPWRTLERRSRTFSTLVSPPVSGLLSQHGDGRVGSSPSSAGPLRGGYPPQKRKMTHTDTAARETVGGYRKCYRGGSDPPPRDDVTGVQSTSSSWRPERPGSGIGLRPSGPKAPPGRKKCSTALSRPHGWCRREPAVPFSSRGS